MTKRTNLLARINMERVRNGQPVLTSWSSVWGKVLGRHMAYVTDTVVKTVTVLAVLEIWGVV